MGIKLNWTPVPGQTLDSIEIYRSNTVIDRGNPGTPIATVAGDATSYEDNTVKNKEMYYYCIAGVKGNERAWGENHQAGYFSETGPGNHSPIRGDWQSGYMDTLTGRQFITGPSLAEKLPKLANLNGISTLDGWWKLCHKGKILFVATNQMYSTPEWVYSNGMLYGVKGHGTTWPHGTDGKVDQLTTVEIGGLEYIVRAARISPDDENRYLSDYVPLGMQNSEWIDTISRVFRRTAGDAGWSKPRFYDVATMGRVFGPGCWGSGKHRAYMDRGYNYSYVDWTGAGYWLMVLELIQP